MDKTQAEIKEIWDSMNHNEKIGSRIGLFPSRLMREINNKDCARLIELAQEEK